MASNIFLTMLTVASVPALLLDTFCLYVVITKSPPKMKKFSKHLAVYQAYTVINDLIFGLFCTPYFSFPTPGIVPVGLLSYTNVPTQIQIVLVEISLVQMELAMCFLFIVRQQHILPTNHALKLNPLQFKILTLCVHVLPVSFIGVLTGYFAIKTDVDKVNAYYFQKHPNVKEIVGANPSFFAFDADSAFFIAANLTTVFCVACSAVVAAVGSSWWAMRTQREIVSKKTLEMQRTWIKILLAQLLIPVITAVSPVVVVAALFFTNYSFTPDIAYCAHSITLLFGLHGAISSLLTLIFYKPYRIYTVSLFNFKKSVTRPTGSKPRPIVFSMERSTKS